LAMRSFNFREFKGLPRLFLDFNESSDSIIKFYKYNHREINSYRQVASLIDQQKFQRERLRDIISSATSGLTLSTETRSNIDKISDPKTLTVFAGQQVGMLLGPIFTVYKAITIHKLAAQLESQLQRPVIPCFWMATDDHDFDEVKSAGLLNRSGDYVNISYEPEMDIAGYPITDIHLDGGVIAFLDDLQKALIETEFTLEILAINRGIYFQGQSMAGAFGELLNKILDSLGIIPIDPNYEGMKELMVPVFRSEIDNHWELFNDYETRSQLLLDAGYHRQVHKNSSNLNLFYNDGIRRSVHSRDEKYSFDNQSVEFDKGGLLRLLENNPSKFSPNVLLRPIAQCHVFPVVAQIVGPSEAAYFAQIEPLFKRFDAIWPVIRPRIFATIIEPHIERIVNKMAISIPSLYNDKEAEYSRVIREYVPFDLGEKISDLKGMMNEQFDDLLSGLTPSDTESNQALNHSRKKIDFEFSQLFGKAFSIHKKRQEAIKDQIERAHKFLFPLGKFQERIISPVYFANKFGLDIFARLSGKLNIDSIEHQIIDTNV